MERRINKERLIVPTDFTSPPISRHLQEDLVPPSHFASSKHSPKPNRGLHSTGTMPSMSHINPGVTPVPSADPSPVHPWLAIAQAQQEILELKKENQRIMMLHESMIRGRIPVEHSLEPRPAHQWTKGDSESSLETEKHKVEAERLKMQLKSLKERTERHEDEIRDRDGILSRQSHELEKTREELSKAEAELHRLREELTHSRTQKEKIHSQLLQLNSSHAAELDAARTTHGELQDRLRSATSEVLQLRSSVMQVSAEGDKLREQCSQMGQAFEAQSATLHGLRNYIGQLAPERQEKEQLNRAVERLNSEKADLQMTAELLTIRLNSVNEILSLQEERLVKKSLTEPRLKPGSEGLLLLKLWREKVFKLCVQLRSKDVELRREKDKLLSKFTSLEQQLQQEQHRAAVLQHTVDDRIAELDLERVEKETMKRDLAQAHKENSQLQLRCEKSEAEGKMLTEAVHRFRLAFEGKVVEVDAAQTRLSTLTQRLAFAHRRVQTIQGLLMRRAALQELHQAGKETEKTSDSLTNLQTQLSLVCEERDELAQELKRTPQLIQKALADLKEQYESKCRQQQQDLEQSWTDRQKAEQSLQQIQARLEESEVSVEKLGSELILQQEQSEQILQQRLSETEGRCAEKLTEMEAEVRAARRGHSRAVMSLRHFERDVAKKQDGAAESQYFRNAHTGREVQDSEKRTVKDKHLQQVKATVPEQELTSVCAAVHTETVLNSAALREQQEPPGRGSRVQPPADERLLVGSGELHVLSAAVVHSSEDSVEEEEEEMEEEE